MAPGCCVTVPQGSVTARSRSRLLALGSVRVAALRLTMTSTQLQDHRDRPSHHSFVTRGASTPTILPDSREAVSANLAAPLPGHGLCHNRSILGTDPRAADSECVRCPPSRRHFIGVFLAWSHPQKLQQLYLDTKCSRLCLIDIQFRSLPAFESHLRNRHRLLRDLQL